MYISPCKKCDPPGGSIFLPKGHNLNTLGRCPLGNATYMNQIFAVSDKTIFSCFSYKSLCKACEPQGYNLNKLGRGLPDDDTYQISRL